MLNNAALDGFAVDNGADHHVTTQQSRMPEKVVGGGVSSKKHKEGAAEATPWGAEDGLIGRDW